MKPAFSSVGPKASLQYVDLSMWSFKGREMAGSGNDIMKMRHVIIAFLRFHYMFFIYATP